MPGRCCSLVVSVGGKKETSATMGRSQVDVEESVPKHSGRLGRREVHSLNVEGLGQGLSPELRGFGLATGKSAGGYA